MNVRLGPILIGVALFGAAALQTEPVSAEPAVTSAGVISGVVRNEQTNEVLPNALVVLQCTCLDGSREAQTNHNGIYAFRGLPPGTYTVQVLAGTADVSKVTTLPRGAKFRANFSLDPKNEFKRMIRVQGASSAMVSAEFRGGSPMFKPRPAPPKHRLAELRKSTIEARGSSDAAEVSSGPARKSASVALDQPAAVKPLPKEYARQVVYSGTMTVSVYELEQSKDSVETLVTDAGGYVQRMAEDSMVLRIPAAEFRTVADSIGKLGRLDEESYEALDVTEDYYDLETRIAVLEKTQTQLMTLLGQARSVKDALEVRAALDEVTLELESALGRQRVLASQVRFSALSLTLAQRAPRSAKPPTNDPFPWVDDIGVEGTAWR